MEFLRLEDVSSQTGLFIKPLVNKTRFNHTRDLCQNAENMGKFLEAVPEEITIDFI